MKKNPNMTKSYNFIFKILGLLLVCIFFSMCKEPSHLQVHNQHLQYIFILPGLYFLDETLYSCKHKRLLAPYISLQIY